MEDKQLDFNAPLLSVRRFASTTVPTEGQKNKKTDNSHGNKPYVPPYYKPDLKSGPIRNAGAVPFTWEQIPGRRKDGEGFQDRSIQRPPVAPKLPPGRTSEMKQQSSEREFEKRATIRPERNDNGLTNGQKGLPTNGNVPKLESSKEGKKEKGDSDSEDGDEVYADALDTLSRTESFFLNCSVSGISGLDDTNVNRSGTTSTDPQTRDYMMDRFLPAAKAMASETPQHTSWRQPVTREQPIMVKNVTNGDKRHPLYQYRPYGVPQYVGETMYEESEDEDGDYDDTANSSAKACGLFPKFCLKNSLCLLNPVPGMKVRSRNSFPPVRNSSTHIKSTYTGSYSATDDENKWEAVYKHKLMSNLQPLDDESKLTSESNQLTYWSDSQTPDGSSPHMHSGGGGISPFRSEAIQSPFNEGMGFLGIPKQVKGIKTDNYFPHKDSKWGSASGSPMVEKILYVDSENVQISVSNLSSSDTNGMIGSKENDSETFTKSREINDSSAAVSSPREIDNLIMSYGKGNIKPKMSEVSGSKLWSSSDRSNTGGQAPSMGGLSKDDVLGQESRSSMPSNMSTRGNLEFEKTEFLKEEDQGSSNVYSLQLPLPPPLPKSPSESWLWRTLPAISSKNGASFHPRKHSAKTPAIDPKWETIVKTSNIHHGHLRFSEELTTPLPQQSET